MARPNGRLKIQPHIHKRLYSNYTTYLGATTSLVEHATTQVEQETVPLDGVDRPVTWSCDVIGKRGWPVEQVGGQQSADKQNSYDDPDKTLELEGHRRQRHAGDILPSTRHQRPTYRRLEQHRASKLTVNSATVVLHKHIIHSLRIVEKVVILTIFTRN